MFILGMMSVFIGISLLAPDESKGMLAEILLIGVTERIEIATYYVSIFQDLKLKTVRL